MRPWFEENAARLAFELDALQRAGIRYELDEQARQAGKLRLQVWVTIDQQETALVADFPDLYPYFRFEVSAPTLNLARHQHPLQKNLCLLPGATQFWHSTDTLSNHLATQLPRLVQSLGDNTLEIAQGEPVSSYLGYHENTMVLVDSGWQFPPLLQHGKLLIGTEQQLVTPHATTILRGAVLQARDSTGATIATSDPTWEQLYKHRLRAQWYRVDELPLHADPHHLLAALSLQFPGLDHHGDTQHGVRININAILFPEEVRWQTMGLGWVFIVRLYRHNQQPQAYYARTGRAGRQDYLQRIPELAPLGTKQIAIAGLGCIGAPSTLHFAKAGMREVRLLDHDHLDPATTVRWPLGIAAAGMQKGAALLQYITTNYPYTTVTAWAHRIGDPNGSDQKVLEWFFDGTHLVYDSTAELGVNHALSELARQRDLPYISIATTPGGWGGRIIRVRPGITPGCWMCALHHLNEGSIPTPPAAPTLIQPEGCASPTFTGTSFDIEQVSLLGVRLAVSTLSAEYPPIEWDIAILALRDEQGNAIAPTWTTHELTRHPLCQNHAPG